MIIRFPTGLYQDVGQIPIVPSDSGNVTFTISSEVPRRSNAVFLQLPIGEELRQRSPQTLSPSVRRTAFGELVYTSSEGVSTDGGSNTRLFEVGEFLEFEDPELLEEVQATLVPDQVLIQHNTNLLDLEAAGLTEEEIRQVTEQAAARQAALRAQLADLQVEIANLESDILENQKSINETSKAIKALEKLSPAPEDILIRLNSNLDDLKATRRDLRSNVNNKKEEATTLYNQILDVSEIVR